MFVKAFELRRPLRDRSLLHNHVLTMYNRRMNERAQSITVAQRVWWRVEQSFEINLVG